jgi:hypothetical protein
VGSVFAFFTPRDLSLSEIEGLLSVIQILSLNDYNQVVIT